MGYFCHVVLISAFFRDLLHLRSRPLQELAIVATALTTLAVANQAGGYIIALDRDNHPGLVSKPPTARPVLGMELFLPRATRTPLKNDGSSATVY